MATKKSKGGSGGAPKGVSASLSNESSSGSIPVLAVALGGLLLALACWGLIGGSSNPLPPSSQSLKRSGSSAPASTTGGATENIRKIAGLGLKAEQTVVNAGHGAWMGALVKGVVLELGSIHLAQLPASDVHLRDAKKTWLSEVEASPVCLALTFAAAVVSDALLVLPGAGPGGSENGAAG